MTQPTIARGAPQTDAEMIAALEQTIENYRIACEGFEHGANVAAERIAQLEAQIEAAHRAIDSIGKEPDGAHTLDFRIAALKAERYELQQTIATLQSQLQSMTTDRDFYENAITDAHEALDQWQGFDEEHGVAERINLVRRHEALASDQMEAAINALVAERDAAEDRVRVLEAQLSKAHRKIANQRDANRRLTEDAHRRKAELAAMKSVAHTEARNWTLTANRLIAARQSRARLVRLVRAKNGEFNHLMKLWGEARAWAAAWRKAAKRWQNELLTPRTVTFRVEKDLSQSSIDRRAQRRAERITSDRRAAEAAEAQERR